MPTSRSTRARCIAITRSGEQCKNYSLNGSDYCRLHQPTDASNQENLEVHNLRQELARLARRVGAAPAPDHRPAPAPRRPEAKPPGAFHTLSDPPLANDEPPGGLSLFDVALLLAAGALLARWLFRRKSNPPS